MSISVKNLSKNYGSQKAVNSISFNVNKGEIIGFLGPNGAGKSTTMKIVTGYLNADGGSVEVCGIPVKNTGTDTKKHIGYLPEANPLYTEMYVREYLHFIGNIHMIKNQKHRIEEIISMVGLTIEAGKKIAQLSKGYKQRVGLAAALLHDPEVLILDEPTTGLDPNQIIEIRELIKKLGKDKTVLFSSHILQEVEAICDRVIIISKGNIVADDQLVTLQSTAGSAEFVRVIFKNVVDSAILEGIEGVSEVQDRSPQEAGFLIKCSDAEKVKKQLLQLSIDNQLDIISLHSEKRNLEDIFRGLTS